MEAAIRSNNNNNNKRRSRKPLTDCTNLSQTSSTSSANNISFSPFKKTPILSSALHKFPNTKNEPVSTHSHNTLASKSSTAVLPPTPFRAPQSSPLPAQFYFFLSIFGCDATEEGACLFGIASDVILEPHSVYIRSQSTADDERKSKGKAIAVPICFPTAPKTEYASDKMNEVGVTRPSKYCTVHHKKKRCGALSDEDEKNDAMPKDFIERQRAYFAEIDAFELSEEEVGSSNELD